MELQSIKQRYGIIGSSTLLNRAIEIAVQVAPTDLTVLITGESGTGKESFPKIIHHLSKRKHGNYIAVNCGAIPGGTIDSELFGHEKGAFTGATDSRKGYFEVANNGTIFLDEVAELPLSTQARLLRVLENGEFMKVGSSKVLKTNVRVVAATNVKLQDAIDNGKFREDLFYRLNTVPILIPALRERKEDIILLFRKFSSDFAEKYRIPNLQLTDDAKEILTSYRWKGNIRQLKNVTEQITIIEKDRIIDREVLIKYLPETYSTRLPVLFNNPSDSHLSERDILYKVLFEMKRDVTDLKKLVADLMHNKDMPTHLQHSESRIIKDIIDNEYETNSSREAFPITSFEKKQPENAQVYSDSFDGPIQDSEIIEESLSLQDKEIEFIKRALKKHKGKRKSAAEDLGISERTLYRKIKEYDIS